MLKIVDTEVVENARKSITQSDAGAKQAPPGWELKHPAKIIREPADEYIPQEATRDYYNGIRRNEYWVTCTIRFPVFARTAVEAEAEIADYLLKAIGRAHVVLGEETKFAKYNF